MSYYITPGVGMSLANPGTGQTFETTVVNNNLTLLENGFLANRARLGVIICTSSTRPSSPPSGQNIIETDTRNTMYWNGTRWVPLDTLPNAATATIRDTLYPTPVAGNQIYRVDLKYAEQYFPAGAVAAGWYPANGAILGCYMQNGGLAANVAVLTSYTTWTEVSDLQFWHDPVTNADRVTPKTPGLYRVAVSFSFAGNATGARIVQLLKNGGLLIEGRINNPDAGNYTVISLNYVTLMNGTTDYFSISQLQNCGGPLTTSGAFLVDYLGPNS